MAINETMTSNYKIVPTSIHLMGNNLDSGQGTIVFQVARRNTDTGITEPPHLELSAKITPDQAVMEAFAKLFESTYNAHMEAKNVVQENKENQEEVTQQQQ